MLYFTDNDSQKMLNSVEQNITIFTTISFICYLINNSALSTNQSKVIF